MRLWTQQSTSSKALSKDETIDGCRLHIIKIAPVTKKTSFTSQFFTNSFHSRLLCCQKSLPIIIITRAAKISKLQGLQASAQDKRSQFVGSFSLDTSAKRDETRHDNGKHTAALDGQPFIRVEHETHRCVYYTEW